MAVDPDWLGPATDLLKEHGLDEAAGVLRAAPARGELLERAVQAMEAMTRHFLEFRGHVPLAVGPILPLVAEHRGEAVEATLARLSPSTGHPTVGHLSTRALDNPSSPNPSLTREQQIEQILREARLGPL